MHERIVPLARFHDHVATLAAIAARWTTAGNKFLPAESNAAVAAIACFYADCGFVDEHSCQLSAISFQETVFGLRRWSLAKPFKHKNAPASRSIRFL
jgi:hypothetical protein